MKITVIKANSSYLGKTSNGLFETAKINQPRKSILVPSGHISLAIE